MGKNGDKRRKKLLQQKRKELKLAQDRKRSDDDWVKKFNQERAIARERIRQTYRDNGYPEERIMQLVSYNEDKAF
jgi:hypothetical protein